MSSMTFTNEDFKTVGAQHIFFTCPPFNSWKSQKRVDTQGYEYLLTTFGDDHASHTISLRYLIINVETSYNILIGRPVLNELGVVVSTLYLAMKFPLIVGNIMTIQEFYVEILKIRKPREKQQGKHGCIYLLNNIELDPRTKEEQRP
ncbi:hypothetical protein CR513_62037, partial [Mucuna pruriens]